jgi:hypothetical protein
MLCRRRAGVRLHGKKSACNFPVIREAIGHAGALYSFKSGFDRESLAPGPAMPPIASN